MTNIDNVWELIRYEHAKQSDLEYFSYSRGLLATSEMRDIQKEHTLGYTLFEIMDSLETFKGCKTNINQAAIENIGKKFYDDEEFFNIFLYSGYASIFDNDGISYNMLLLLKHYLDLCSVESKYCSLEYLVALASYEYFEIEPLSLAIGYLQKDVFDINSSDDVKKLFDIYESNKSSENPLYYSRTYSGLVDLCFASLQCIFDENYIIKKCENCGKYFIPFNRTDTIYCTRISPQDSTKTCGEFGALQAYKRNLETNEASGLYRAIYMQKQMLVRRNPDIQVYKEDFNNFKIQSKKWKTDIKSSIKTETDYISWLESIKSKR